MNLNFQQAAFLWLWNKLNKLFKSVLESTFYTKGERECNRLYGIIFFFSSQACAHLLIYFKCNHLPFCFQNRRDFTHLQAHSRGKGVARNIAVCEKAGNVWLRQIKHWLSAWFWCSTRHWPLNKSAVCVEKGKLIIHWKGHLQCQVCLFCFYSVVILLLYHQNIMAGHFCCST